MLELMPDYYLQNRRIRLHYKFHQEIFLKKTLKHHFNLVQAHFVARTIFFT